MAFGHGPKVQRGSRRFVLAAGRPIRAQNKAIKAERLSKAIKADGRWAA
jgi:hypothetical protein